MTTETILTDEEVRRIKYSCSVIAPDDFFIKIVRAIEQAVMQSPEVQALRKDAERVEFIEARYGADIACFDSGDWEVSSGDMCFGEGRSLRSAIDAAMEQQK